MALRTQFGNGTALIVFNLLVAGSYWSLAAFVRWYFSHYQMWPAPLWFPAGVAMSAIYLFGRRTAPGIFFGSLLANVLTFHSGIPTGAVVALGNTVGPLAAVAFLRNRIRGERAFSCLTDVSWFATSCFFNGSVSATVSGLSFGLLSRTAWGQAPTNWITWTFSDACACLLLVPLFVLMLDRPPAVGRSQISAAEIAATFGVSLAATAYFLFRSSGHLAADAGSSFLILLPLLWAAVRFSLRVAYPLFVSILAIVVTATLAGYGPYSAAAAGGKVLIFSQMSIGFGIAILMLEAVSYEHRSALDSLFKLSGDLERRIDERTAELQQSKRLLEQVAFHDPLTGLPNRRFFEDRFAAALAMAVRKGSKVVLLLLDLDHFKRVNDTLGHDAGDTLLIDTGKKLSAAVREYDFVARLGGDEFAVLLPDVPEPKHADSICARIVQSLTRKLSFDGIDVGTGPSIGISTFPHDGTSWHELYKAADVALYSAKQNGRGRWEWYKASAKVSTPQMPSAAGKGSAQEVAKT